MLGLFGARHDQNIRVLDLFGDVARRHKLEMICSKCSTNVRNVRSMFEMFDQMFEKCSECSTNVLTELQVSIPIKSVYIYR